MFIVVYSVQEESDYKASQKKSDSGNNYIER